MEEKKKNNMEIYNLVREVPKEAQKTIGAGRLKGMTDIKPQWRIEKLTEIFGPCGFGWKTVIKSKEIIEGANEEKIAIVDIDLYIKNDKGEWSEAIEGTGGSSFVAKESKGLYTSDECFKMAYTDALSVACKALGIGADVYWGESKYAKKEEDKPELISKAQIDLINKIFNTDERMKKLLDKYNLNKIEEMPKSTASDIIKKNLAKKEEK